MEQLEEALTCPVCCELFEDPRVLLCSHSFCRKCLEGLLEGLRASRTPLKCPTCRKESPHNGAGSLQINYSLRNIVENFSKIKAPPKMPACKQHDQSLNIFCATDHRLICGFCATAEAHRGHELCSLEEAYEREKKESELLIRRVESWRSEEARSRLETLQADKKHALQAVSGDAEQVADYFRKLIGALESKQSEILSDFETLRLQVMLRFDPELSKLREALEEQRGALHIAQSLRSASEEPPLVFLQQMQEFREKMKVLEETPLLTRKDVGALVRNVDVKKWDSLQLGEVDKICVPHESGAGGSRMKGCRWVVLVLIPFFLALLLFLLLFLLLLHIHAADDGIWMRVTELSSHTKEMTGMLMAAGQKYITNLIDSTVHFMSTFKFS